MDQYLKQKLPAVDPTKVAQDAIDKELKYRKDLLELMGSKPEMVEDFQKPLVKDLPVQKIDTKVAQPLTSGADFAAKQAARSQAVKQVANSAENVLDYGQFRKEFADKARQIARTPVAKNALSILPFAGAAYGALSGDPAMAAEELAQDAAGPAGLAYEAIKPVTTGPAAGSLDERIEKGTLTDEDKQSLRMQALKQLR